MYINKDLFILYMWVFYLHVCMHVFMHAWCLRKPEKGTGLPKTGDTHGCELSFLFWEPNPFLYKGT